MQRNLTESLVRSSLYKTCNILNTLLIQYSNVGCFSANIIRVQFLCGEGGACSLNGVEYTYVQERKMHKVDSYGGVIKDYSCLGSDTERFMKFSQSQDDIFSLIMLPISLTIISTSTVFVLYLSLEQKPVVWVETVSSPGLKMEPHVLLGDNDTGHVRFFRRQWFPRGSLDTKVLYQS